MKPTLLIFCLFAFTACTNLTKSGRCGTYRRDVEYRENFENPGRGYECPRGLFGDYPGPSVRPRIERHEPNSAPAQMIAGILGLISPANKTANSDYTERQREFRGDWWP